MKSENIKSKVTSTGVSVMRSCSGTQPTKNIHFQQRLRTECRKTSSAKERQWPPCYHQHPGAHAQVTLLLLPTVPGLHVAHGGARAGDLLLLLGVAVVDPAAGAGAAQPGRAPRHVAGAGGALAAHQGPGASTQVVS